MCVNRRMVAGARVTMLPRHNRTKLDAHQVGARVAPGNSAVMRRQRGARIDAKKKGETMADATQSRNTGPDDVFEEPVPAMQQLLDNPFLLLFIGIALPTVLYIVWGVMEIVSIPVAK